MKGWMYILKCVDDSYYTGSTNNLELRLKQHQNGEGANHTAKRLPVELVYFEEFSRIDEAFYREKQVQGWSRKKKEALIEGAFEGLHELAKCRNGTSHIGFGSAQPTCFGSPHPTCFGTLQPNDSGSARPMSLGAVKPNDSEYSLPSSDTLQPNDSQFN